MVCRNGVIAERDRDMGHPKTRRLSGVQAELMFAMLLSRLFNPWPMGGRATRLGSQETQSKGVIDNWRL